MCVGTVGWCSGRPSLLSSTHCCTQPLALSGEVACALVAAFAAATAGASVLLEGFPVARALLSLLLLPLLLPAAPDGLPAAAAGGTAAACVLQVSLSLLLLLLTWWAPSSWELRGAPSPTVVVAGEVIGAMCAAGIHLLVLLPKSCSVGASAA